MLYLGTLNRLRRLDTLFHAARLVKAAGRLVVLVFVGDGPTQEDEQFLRKRAQELKLINDVRFVGRIPRSATGDYIAAADIGLSYFSNIPLFWQNSPTKVMEYLGGGLPVVCTPQPEQMEIVQACDGGVVSEDDTAEAVAKAIIKALDRSWSREQLRTCLLALRDYEILTEKVEQIFATAALGNHNLYPGERWRNAN